LTNKLRTFFDPRMSCPSGSYSPSGEKPGWVVADQSSRELIETLSFEAADPSDLKLAHDAAYVRDVLDGVRTNGHGNCRLEVADSTLWTVGSMIAAARDALQSRIAFSPSSGFHHAGFDWNHGFCTFNGLVVAARKLLIEGKVTKVGLLDCDWHLGDGTEAIIQRLGLQAQLLHFTSGASHFADTLHGCGNRCASWSRQRSGSCSTKLARMPTSTIHWAAY
jgi:acetoin utilization deacetylase AcuC-like enzyme